MRMKQQYLLIPLFTLMVFVPHAHATNLYQQTIFTGQETIHHNNSQAFVQTLGTGLTGTVYGYTTFYATDQNTGNPPALIRQCDNGNYATTTTCTNYVLYSGTTNATSTNTKVYYDEILATPFTFNPSKFYYFEFNGTGAFFEHTIYGDDYSDNYANGSCYIINSGNCSNLNDVYFQIYDGNGAAIIGSTGDVKINSPLQGSTQSSPVAFNILVNDPLSLGYNHLKVLILDSTSVTGSAAYSKDFNISTSTSQSVVGSTVLTNGHLYTIQATASYDTNAGTTIYSNTASQMFSVGTDFNTLFAQNFNNPIFVSTTTAQCSPPSSVLDVGGGVMWAFCYLFVPSPQSYNQFASIPGIFATKIPFSYIGDINSLITSISSASNTTTPNASFTFPLGGTFTPPGGGTPTQSFTLFNPSTVMNDVPILSTMRTFMGYALYMLFGMFAFTRVMKVL